MPQPPATPTVGSSSARDQRRDDVAGRLDARVEDDDDRRRSPAGCPCSAPPPARGARTSGRPRSRRSPRSARASAAVLLAATDRRPRPRRRRRPARGRARPASARSTSAGQSVATRTTVASPLAGSSSRDGTSRARSVADDARRSATSADAAGVRAKSVPAVDDLPAGRLDLVAEAVGLGPVARVAGRGALVGERPGLVGDEGRGSPAEG